jgi:hypothetical protein
MTHETKEGFKTTFNLLWDTIREVTKRLVQFEILHGDGLGCINLDGSKPQIEGLAKAFYDQFRDHTKMAELGIFSPDDVILYIIKQCDVHIMRYVIFVYCSLFLTWCPGTSPSFSRMETSQRMTTDKCAL